MKALCEECDGKGYFLGVTHENGSSHGFKKECPDCKGKGYIEENDKIELEEEDDLVR